MKKKTVQIFWCNSNITAAVYNSSLSYKLQLSKAFD